VDYLLKPFSFERFLKAVNKIDGNTAATPPPSPTGGSFLYFRVDRKMTRVELDEILYIESLKDYSRIVRTIQKPLVMKKSISSIEEMLPADQFIRIHRSFIVAIQKVNAYTQHHIEVGIQQLPIGKVYRHHLLKLARFTPPEGF